MPSRDFSQDPPQLEIIKGMYDRAKLSDHYFNCFINLWTSFNAFYTLKYGDELNGRKNNDRYLLNKFCTVQKYIQIYQNLIINSESFKENLFQFMTILNYTKFPGKIRDLRIHNRENESAAKSFSSVDNFEEFIWITYQIRNNLIHGNKSNENEADIKIVKTIFNLFIEFLSEIYKQEGITHD